MCCAGQFLPVLNMSVCVQCYRVAHRGCNFVYTVTFKMNATKTCKTETEHHVFNLHGERSISLSK
jgi:hypothetical protein